MAERTAAAPGRASHGVRAAAIAIAGLLVLAATSTLPAGAAPGQDPGLPVVSATGTNGADTLAVDCLGQPDQQPGTPGAFTFTRTGPTDEALAIEVDYTRSGTGLPDPVVIPAGASTASVAVPVELQQLGATISTTADYEVTGGFQTVQVFVSITVADLYCNLGYVEEVVRIVPPGQVPAPIDLAEVGVSTTRATELRIVGDQPPGTALQLDGTWVGAPSQLGIYEASAYWCETSTWCPQELLVTVIVTDDDPFAERPTPPATPPPARPIPGAPTLTG
jgi:hypothetical protein